MLRSVVTRVFLSVLLILNGCASVDTGKFVRVPDRPLTLALPDSGDDEAIIAGKKAIVFMRLNITLDGEPVESPADYVEFGLGSIYWTALLPVVPKVPSEQAKRKGWIYFVLNPGRYNFWVLPSGGSPKDYRFQMEVPDKSHIVYMGTLKIACSKSGSCDKPELQSDQKSALEFAESFFSYWGTPTIVSIKPYRPPSDRIPQDLFPLAILVQGAPKPLDVVPTEALESGSIKGGGGGLRGLDLRGAPVGGAALLDLAIIGTILIVVGTATAIEYLSREREPSGQQGIEPRLKACEARILEESAAIQSNPIYLRSILDSLEKQGATRLLDLKPDEDLFSKARQAGSRTLLQTGLTRVGLGVTGDGSACLQTAVTARLWDVREAKLLYEKTWLRRCDEGTTELSALSRARFPFAAYDEGHLVDDWSGKYFQSLDSACRFQSETVRTVAFSPDGKLLASGSDDKTVILWDVVTRTPVGKPLTGHTDRVTSVAFSPDGKLLASGSDDGRVILWDVAIRAAVAELFVGQTMRQTLTGALDRAAKKLLNDFSLENRGITVPQRVP